ncbi:MAG: EAL domain-containing protein [Steroidobacteraceae bacterium]
MSGELKILMLEDVPEEAEVLRRELRKSGLEFVARRVQTRQAFGEALEQFSPDLVLADSRLPAFDGRTALQMVRQKDPLMPVIMVTGALGDEAAVEFLIAGASDYVLKDRLARLAPAVQRALRDAAMSREQQVTEQRIRRLTRVLQMLSGINTAVVRIRDQPALLEEACRIAYQVGHYAYAFVALIDPGKGVARPVAWAGRGAEGRGGVKFGIGNGPDADCSVTGRVLRTGDLIAFDNPKDYVGPISDLERIETVPNYCLASFPLLVDNTPVGAFTVASTQHGMLGDEELDLLQEMVANLSFALQYLHKDSALRYLSYFDPLTDLANRTLFCERLARLISPPPSLAAETVVAAFNVQCLSLINDSFGHHIGDLLLQCVADRLRQRFDGSERVAHLGGDAFAVVFPHDSMPPGPHAQISDAFVRPLIVKGREIPAPVKCGLARFPTDGNAAEMLVQNAEAALHAAQAGSSSYAYYRQEMSSSTAERLALEHRLRGALDRGEFVLYYQPQIHRREHRIVAVEALLRWQDPERGLVAPGEFLPVLESTGLILSVGEWVLRQAAEDCRRWRHFDLPRVRVAINVSTAELSQPGLAARFLHLAAGPNGSEVDLDLEITEGELLQDSASVTEALQQLRAEGVRVAIDDFGTGFSSLSRLSELPIDILKIDCSFVRRLTPDRASHAIVSTIIALARSYDLDTVAEGVETPAQLEILAALGCEISQGYLHSPAVPAATIEALLRAHPQRESQ